MYNRKFYSLIVFRILLILVICIAISFANTFKERWFTIFGLLILLLLQIAELIGYIFRVGNNTFDFITSLNNNDITIPSTGHRSSLVNEKFAENLITLKKKISYIKSEQLVQTLFIENLLEHLEIGIIAILPDGKLKFKNNAVLRLLSVETFNNLESLRGFHPEFYYSLINIKPGENKLVTLSADNEIRKISLKATLFKSENEEIKLVFFQDIKNEIDESLLQSWQNLIRILTHEINNTVSPIASLADSLSIYLSKDGNKVEPIIASEINQKAIDNSLEGLNIIKERSDGLIEFVSKYKSLLPKKSLTISKIVVSDLFYRLKVLFSEKLEKQQILLITSIQPHDLTIHADQHYFEQVLINLISNSIEAFDNFTSTSKQQIELVSFQGENDETIVQVIDNGKGIAGENLDKVFIPFYSTKEKGTGIGLSLSMQIIRLHGGIIKVSSKESEKTVFSIKI